MSNLEVIPGAAVLVRNGIIEQAGRATRIENLRIAREAKEIDARGRIVMPALIDADTELVVAPPPKARKTLIPDERCHHAMRVTSVRNLTERAANLAQTFAESGCIAIGAPAAGAPDYRNALKILRIHRSLQGRPLRIRSVFCPTAGMPTQELVSRVLPAVRAKKLASVLELSVDAMATGLLALTEAAAAGAGLGFAIRVRSTAPPSNEALEFALATGSIAIVAPPERGGEPQSQLSAMGCVRVLPIRAGEGGTAPHARALVDAGAAVALTTGYRPSSDPVIEPRPGIQEALLGTTGSADESSGLSLEEAIVAITYNAACSLRLSHVCGSVEPGKWADLLIMDTADYRDLGSGAGADVVVRAGDVLRGTH